MIFFNDIVMFENIQRKNVLLRNIQALVVSLAIYTTLILVIFYVSSAQPVVTKSEKIINISLSEFSSTSGDKQILDKPKTKENISKPMTKPQTEKKILKHTISKSPEKIPLHSPVVSSEESKPAVQPHVETPSLTNSDSLDAKGESKNELSENKSSAQELGGATPEQIWAMIKNAVKYPPVARKMKIEGVVVVFIVINPDGTVKTAKVKTTSGSNLLDDRAIQTIMNLSGHYPAPKKSLGLSFPIAFSLKKS
ncbi:MAG: energy transducer TonB [Sulfurovaceae bacterium]|nr:energy transducer TonB [Sulfurovaceae bacterium]